MNFIGFYLVVELKAGKQVFSLIPALGIGPLFKYLKRYDGISRCTWASSDFPKCRQRNHYSCYKCKP